MMNDKNLQRFWRDIDDLGSDNANYRNAIQKNIEIIHYDLNLEYLTHLIQSKLMHAIITVDAQILLEKVIEIILKDTATIMYLKQPDEYDTSKAEKWEKTTISSGFVQ